MILHHPLDSKQVVCGTRKRQHNILISLRTRPVFRHLTSQCYIYIHSCKTGRAHKSNGALTQMISPHWRRVKLQLILSMVFGLVCSTKPRSPNNTEYALRSVRHIAFQEAGTRDQNHSHPSSAMYRLLMASIAFEMSLISYYSISCIRL